MSTKNRLPLTPEQQQWLDDAMERAPMAKKPENPCISLYGPGPVGAKCKTCSHLYWRRLANTYFKCDLRANTNGPASDHRVNWPACEKYQKVT